MKEEWIYFGCMAITVVIEMIIMSQFIEERYKRSYGNRNIYVCAKLMMGVLITCVNLLRIPAANFFVWGITVWVLVGSLYYHERKRTWMCVLEAEIVFLIFCVCESVGHIGLKIILSLMKMPNVEGMMFSGLVATVSNVIIIFFWYVFIVRIWTKEHNLRYTKSQYFTHIVIAVYTMANLMVILYVLPHVTTRNEQYLLLINMLCIVFADMYFLYFIKCIAQKTSCSLKKNC